MQRGIIVSEPDLERLRDEIVEHVTCRIEEVVARGATERAVGREEMARLLGVGIATIDRLVRDNVIPSLMPCNRRIFLPSRVYSALESQRLRSEDT